MADRSISELNAAEQVNNSDLFVLQQGGDAKRLSGQTLINHLLNAIGGLGNITSIVKVADTTDPHYSAEPLVDTYKIQLANTDPSQQQQTPMGAVYYYVKNGRGIDSITWTTSGTSKNGQRHRGTIHFDDGTDSPTFDIYDGLKGDTGTASYLHIRYASVEPTAASHDMSTDPNNWIGLYVDTTQADSTDWQSYSWFKIKGEQGDTGPAPTITTEVKYQASGSGTTPPVGTWHDNPPQVSQGDFLWTRVTMTISGVDNPVVWYSVSHEGLDGTGAVDSVNGQTGAVTITAENLGSVGTGTVPDGSLAQDIQTLRDADQTLSNNKQDKITASGILKGDRSAVSAATKGTDYGALSFTFPIPTGNWSSTTGGYQKTVTISSGDANYGKFLATGYAYQVSPAFSSLDVYTASQIFVKDISTDNQVPVFCKNVPSTTVTLNVVRMVSA